MTIVASNNLTVSNVSDGTITHTAYSWSADGTDGFTTVYPNLNLLTNSRLQSMNIAPFFATNNSVATINSNVKGLNVSYSGGAIYSQGGVGQGGIPVSAGNQYTISVKVINTGTVAINKFLLQFGFDSSTRTPLAYPNKTFSLPADGKAYSFSYTYTAPENAIVMRYYCLVVATEANVPYTFTIYDMKGEQGSIATPYMPSSSEATTADYPSYRGEYSDISSEQSTNPSDYTWTIVRGNDGTDGVSPTVKINPDTSLTIVDAKGTSKTPMLKGTDGLAGKDGVGVKATVITYAISTSGTTAPTTDWTSSVPGLVKGQYLWTKTVWTYTDNSSETGYSVTYISKDGTDGDDGLPGKDGVGIKTTTITYAGSTSGTIAPTSGWTSTVPTVEAGSYLWTKTVWAYTDNTSETGYSVARMGLKGDKGDPGVPGVKGSDGTSGIIVSSVPPDSPQTGQLWQDTSTTPQLVKKWTGASWVIWELYVENMNVNNLSALSTILGDIDGGTLKLMDDNFILNGQPKMYGIYQSKFGLISSGPTFETTGILSNTQMSVASLNKGGMRFIVTDYTEDLKNLQESGMSDQNYASIKFRSYENGKDIMLIESSGDIVFKGNTSQDTPWVTLSSGVKYKFMFSRMYISVDVVGDGGSFMQFGTLPQNLRPVTDQFLIIANQGAGTADDRHIMVRASDGAVILWTPKSGITYRGEVSYTL